MATVPQIRAARALLGWSQKDLADHAGLSQTGIARIENGSHQPNAATMDKIINAFSLADIEFLETTGVRKKSGAIRVLRGADELRQFMDDVYVTARTVGGDICLFNAKPENWLLLLGRDWCVFHANRMVEICQNYRFRTIAKESDQFLIGQGFIEYRWIPEDMFSERSFYCYGNKLAFLDFRKDDVEVWVLEHKEYADGFRILFEIAWDLVATPAVADPGKDVRNL